MAQYRKTRTLFRGETMLRTLACALPLLVSMLWTAAASAQPVTFSRTDYRSDSGTRAIVSGDFNLDHWPDIATANTVVDTVTVLLNKGNGQGFTSTNIPVSAGPFDMAAADINGDFRLDLVVAAADADRIEILLGKADGSFAAPVHVAAVGNPRGLAVRDINGDGRADLIYTSYALNRVTILLGAGGTSFTAGGSFATGPSPQGVAITALNNDGIGDFVVANTGSTNLSLFTSSPTGYIRTDIPSLVRLNTIAEGHLDGNGFPDLYGVSTASNAAVVFFNAGNGLSAPVKLTSSLSSPRGAFAVDLNTDGFAELLVANRGSSTLTVFLSSPDPSSRYTQFISVPAGAGSRAVIAADFDGDNRIDVATGNEYARAASVFYTRPLVGSRGWEMRELPHLKASFGSWVSGVGDFNGNGIPDVIGDQGVILDAKTPVAVPSTPDNGGPTMSAVGDFNGDGRQDYAQVVQYTDGGGSVRWNVNVHLGDGHGGFASAPVLPLNGATRGFLLAGDVNGDGRTDLFLYAWDGVASAGTQYVFLGAANGTFATRTAAVSLEDSPFALRDLNRDGKVDLVAADGTSSSIKVFYGDGAGNFSDVRVLPSGDQLSAWGTIADINEDGLLDIATMGPRGRLLMWFGRADGSFSDVRGVDLPPFAYTMVLADFTGDGHLDVITGEGTFAAGHGDGTFDTPVTLNVRWDQAYAADVNRDGLSDIVFAQYLHPGMIVYSLTSRGENFAPVISGLNDLTFPYTAEFDEDELGLFAGSTYDPNLDPITYEWVDDHGSVIGSDVRLPLYGRAPGTYSITLIARDDHGGESKKTVTVTVLPYKEIVLWTAVNGQPNGAWRTIADSTAADDGTALWHPNANAPKLAAPLASPTNYVDIDFHPDPTQVYKLWVRLKAQSNYFNNDSVFVQFSGAQTPSGTPVYQIGSTNGLAINLEECSGCGLSGWGWRDDAWGAKGIISSVQLKFPQGGVQRIRVQTREDGVMIDQIVLSSSKYLTVRPGAVKNDTVILQATELF